jgi:hypothetical protein
MGGKTTLQELRDLNVRRQREMAEVESEPATAEETSDDAQMRKGADAHMLAHASTEAREEASTPAREQVSAEVSARASTEGSKRASAPVLPSASGELSAAVRDALTLRRLHSGGTKASVDMSPELSLRLKRYCLDHGNVSSRQVMLELLIAFLDREGY